MKIAIRFPNPESLRGCPKASKDPISGATLIGNLSSAQGGNGCSGGLHRRNAQRPRRTSNAECAEALEIDQHSFVIRHSEIRHLDFHSSFARSQTSGRFHCPNRLIDLNMITTLKRTGAALLFRRGGPHENEQRLERSLRPHFARRGHHSLPRVNFLHTSRRTVVGLV